MGRIKTSLVKRIGEKIYEQYKDKFSGDFEKNKEIVKQILPIQSKKMINVITGYITRLAEREEE